MLPEFGEKGQECLAAGRVLIIGAGGPGSSAAIYLTTAGIGTIGIADPDKVELSNPQPIHAGSRPGMLKTESAKLTMNSLNPDTRVICYNEKINASNIKDIITDKNYDFIIDAADNFQTKYIINDACVLLKKPFSHGSVQGLDGRLMTYIPGKGPCCRCVFEKPPETAYVETMHAETACDDAAREFRETGYGENGTHVVVPDIIGTLQAAEAIKYLLGMDNLLNGYILSYNALSMEFGKIRVERNIDCAVCGKK